MTAQSTYSAASSADAPSSQPGSSINIPGSGISRSSRLATTRGHSMNMPATRPGNDRARALAMYPPYDSPASRNGPDGATSRTKASKAESIASELASARSHEPPMNGESG